MFPTITETIKVSIEISNTAFISVTTTTVTTDTFSTIGTIYLPAPSLIYNPIAIMSSLLLFIFIGSATGKPTLLSILWFGLAIFGIFDGQSAYWSFSLLVILSAVMLYKVTKASRET